MTGDSNRVILIVQSISASWFVRSFDVSSKIWRTFGVQITTLSGAVASQLYEDLSVASEMGTLYVTGSASQDDGSVKSFISVLKAGLNESYKMVSIEHVIAYTTRKPFGVYKLFAIENRLHAIGLQKGDCN